MELKLCEILHPVDLTLTEGLKGLNILLLLGYTQFYFYYLQDKSLVGVHVSMSNLHIIIYTLLSAWQPNTLISKELVSTQPNNFYTAQLLSQVRPKLVRLFLSQ